jgi:hypothetical protein
MDLTTNGVVITNAIKFVQNSKEKLKASKEDDDKESKEPDYENEYKGGIQRRIGRGARREDKRDNKYNKLSFLR